MKTIHHKKHPVWHIVEISKMSYVTLIMIWAGMTLGFGLIYFLLDTIAPAHGPQQLIGQEPMRRLFNAIYFSIITATSTGYGDITPMGISKAFAAFQSITSLFVFATLVTKLVSQRQEIALQEVHKLTYEDIFHNTREDLYVIRKDFDLIIGEAENTGAISEDSWDTIMVAFQQMQNLIQEIPEFYDSGNDFYTIDAKREELLIEGVERTCQRVNTMLNTFSRLNINWPEHSECTTELEELVGVLDEIIPIWQKRSPHNKKIAFEDILSLKEGIHTQMTQALPS